MYFYKLWCQSNVFNQWIHDLYVDYKKEKSPVQDFFYTKKGIPPSLIAIDTDAMKIVDFYQFDMNVHPMSIQFIPKTEIFRSAAGSRWIFVVFYQISQNKRRCIGILCELWVMDANDIKKARSASWETLISNFVLQPIAPGLRLQKIYKAAIR